MLIPWCVSEVRFVSMVCLSSKYPPVIYRWCSSMVALRLRTVIRDSKAGFGARSFGIQRDSYETAMHPDNWYRYPGRTEGVSAFGRVVKGLGDPLSMSPFSQSSAFFNYHTSTGIRLHCQYGNCLGVGVTPRDPGLRQSGSLAVPDEPLWALNFTQKPDLFSGSQAALGRFFRSRPWRIVGCDSICVWFVCLCGWPIPRSQFDYECWWRSRNPSEIECGTALAVCLT